MKVYRLIASLKVERKKMVLSENLVLAENKPALYYLVSSASVTWTVCAVMILLFSMNPA